MGVDEKWSEIGVFLPPVSRTSLHSYLLSKTFEPLESWSESMEVHDMHASGSITKRVQFSSTASVNYFPR